MEHKFTKGNWKLLFAHGCCIGIGTIIEKTNEGTYSQVISNTILPNTDEEYEAQKEEILANATLMSAAPDLLAACIEFVRKVEVGEAKSTRSYKQMKAAIEKATTINLNQTHDNV